MKATGYIRKVDKLGRLGLPVKLRRALSIKATQANIPGEVLEIYVDGEELVLTKYVPACLFCGSKNDIKEFKEKNIYAECIRELVRLSK